MIQAPLVAWIGFKRVVKFFEDSNNYREIPMPNENADRAWEKRVEAVTNRAQRLETENSMLKSQISLLEAQKAQWEMERVNQNTIIKNALDNSNSSNNEQLEEITILQAKIRELKKELRELKAK
jgi:predicted RNase H-like nuclease (RuvC/YqgF family)